MRHAVINQAGAIDVPVLAVDITCVIAMAKFQALADQSHRMAELVAEDAIPKQEAVDILRNAARANDMIRVHGEDFIQELIASGFEVSA